MPTIKTKKEMNLPELIEWGFENEIKNKQYFCNENNSKSLTFNSYGNVEFSNFYPYFPIDTFTVEVQEEITEDTVLPKLVTRTVKGHYGLWKKGSINSLKHITFNDVEAFYIPNDDLTMTLIWTREKGLVE